MTTATRNGATPTQSDEDLQAEIARLRSENERLKGAAPKRTLRVAEKGGISLYGLGRFPITLYPEQWDVVLDMADEIRTFRVANAAELQRRAAARGR